MQPAPQLVYRGTYPEADPPVAVPPGLRGTLALPEHRHLTYARDLILLVLLALALPWLIKTLIRAPAKVLTGAGARL